jgi:hypothetical protein
MTDFLQFFLNEIFLTPAFPVAFLLGAGVTGIYAGHKMEKEQERHEAELESILADAKKEIAGARAKGKLDILRQLPGDMKIGDLAKTSIKKEVGAE